MKLKKKSIKKRPKNGMIQPGLTRQTSDSVMRLG
jgi:hypothetical protein